MFCQAGFDQWQTTIMQHLSPLSKPQATVLALWSFGMVLARSCALTAVSHFLAKGMQRKEQSQNESRGSQGESRPRAASSPCVACALRYRSRPEHARACQRWCWHKTCSRTRVTLVEQRCCAPA
jgi:hypothetical protein